MHLLHPPPGYGPGSNFTNDVIGFREKRVIKLLQLTTGGGVGLSIVDDITITIIFPIELNLQIQIFAMISYTHIVICFRKPRTQTFLLIGGNCT